MNNALQNTKPTDFEEYLKEQIKNPEFKKYYDIYDKQLRVAYRISQLRRKAGISQQKLAKQVGTTQSNIARMESGRQNFTIETLAKIAGVFGKELRVSIG
ncbi:helix-turn-helix transcriptional regulator [bacterium]|nr:helix-turn-helix transcriptional regulator [bacterium]